MTYGPQGPWRERRRLVWLYEPRGEEAKTKRTWLDEPRSEQDRKWPLGPHGVELWSRDEPWRKDILIEKREQKNGEKRVGQQ